MKKSFQTNSIDAEEKKNNESTTNNADPMSYYSGSRSSDFVMMGGDGSADTPRDSEISAGEQYEMMSITSDVAIVMSDGGDPLMNNHTHLGIPHLARSQDDAIMTDDNNSSPENKWSKILSTPSNNPIFTPSSDTSSLKQNLHGLGLKYSVDRSKILSRTGKGCATLLFEIATCHDELTSALNKLCPTMLESAAAKSELKSMETFASDVNRCILSFTTQTQTFGACIRNDIARPYQENSVHLAEEGLKQYSQYTASRGKCAHARKEAYKLQKKYVESVKEVDVAIGILRKARASKGRKRKTTESSNGESSREEEGVEMYATWEEELRQFGDKNGLSKQCESVIRASEEVGTAQTNYTVGVTAENVAVEDAQDMERVALDSVQRLEEERIVFLIGLLDRFLQDEKESLDNMSLDLTSVEPLDLADGNHKELPVVPLSPMPAASPSLFMSPRRRAQSDDGPAINETRMLNLPDNIAGIRDNMKSMIGRQLSRLKALKLVASFNESTASAIENFAYNLRGQLECSHSTVVLNKNEGTNVLSAWNSAIGSLEMYAQNADVLARQIRRGNQELQQILQPAERESRLFQEKEEFRWKSLCEAARVETKAKMKHKQCVTDLEKVKARLTLVKGEGGIPEGSGAGDGDNNGGNTSPLKPKPQSTKMNREMNKAMGKMFSILPGGGEDVMNKVLTPQQRQAIAIRQLDEAKVKEGKGNESFEIARTVKHQAATLYKTDAEATEFKFKSEERHEWNMMQTSLVGSVDAMRNFREGHLECVMSSIDEVKGHLQGKALDDVTQWTAFTEKRVKDQRARSVDDTKDEEGQSSECGFCLKVQPVECTDVKEVIRRFLDDVDVLDDADICREDDTPSKEVHIDVKEAPVAPLPDVPADSIVEKMDPIFSKKLKSVSIDEYYAAGWSEETPLYGPWLERKGSFEVSVGDWEHSPDDGFENHHWSGEKFTQKRVVRFKFKRSTHLYIGPPVAGVTQTQYLFKDGNDRCVVMMTVEMDGIPYSDSFAVEVRWAARRLKESDIAIDAGVVVRFTKSNMFASKIKSGTLKETSPIHLDLFEEIKSAISSSEGGEHIKDLEVESDEEIINIPIEVEELETTTNETLSQIESMYRQFVAAFSSLTQNQQLLLVFVVLYFATRILIRKDSSAGAIDDLAQKVDGLTKEVRELKAMLESILKLSEQSSNQDEL